MKAKQRSGNRGATAHQPPKPLSPSRRDVFARIRRSVVAIVHSPVIAPGQTFNPKQIVIAGSGFYVEQNGLVVTAGHVLDRWLPGIQQALADGSTPDMPAILTHGPVQDAGRPTATWQYFLTGVTGLFRSGNYDLALLQTDPVGDIASAICAVDFATTHCSEGDHVATCGYPFGVELHAGILGNSVSIIPSFSQGVVDALLPHNAAPPSALKRFQIHAMISGETAVGLSSTPTAARSSGSSRTPSPT